MEPNSWKVRIRTKEDLGENDQLCELILPDSLSDEHFLIFKKEYDVLMVILKHERSFLAYDIIVKNHCIINLELNGNLNEPAFLPESINELKYLQWLDIFSSKISLVKMKSSCEFFSHFFLLFKRSKKV